MFLKITRTSILTWLVTFGLVLAGNHLALAQNRIEKFTHEPAKFVEELTELFSDSKKGEGKEFIEKHMIE